MVGKAITTAKALSGRNARIWELFLDNWTQTEIAAELGITQGRVSQIIRLGAGEVDIMPREEILRSRLAQIDARISYWSAIAMDDSRPLDSRYKADKRVGDWWDRRARLTGENAPDKHFVAEGEVVRYVIEDSPEMQALK